MLFDWWGAYWHSIHPWALQPYNDYIIWYVFTFRSGVSPQNTFLSFVSASPHPPKPTKHGMIFDDILKLQFVLNIVDSFIWCQITLSLLQSDFCWWHLRPKLSPKRFSFFFFYSLGHFSFLTFKWTVSLERAFSLTLLNPFVHCSEPLKSQP